MEVGPPKNGGKKIENRSNRDPENRKYDQIVELADRDTPTNQRCQSNNCQKNYQAIFQNIQQYDCLLML